MKTIAYKLTQKQAEERLIAIIKDETNIDITSLDRLDSTDMDSLDMVEIVMRVEEEWKLAISDKISERLARQTVAQIASWLIAEEV